jgi:hypothetical protein
MQYYADADEREQFISGLRSLAEYLEANPLVPVPRRTDVLVFPANGSDAAMFAEIDMIAERIGTEASAADSPRGHYSAVRDFGPVQYRAVAIPNAVRGDENQKAE